MPTFPVTTFLGGAADKFESLGPGFGQRFRNLFLDEKAAPFQRPGIVGWSAQMPSGNAPANDVAVFEGLFDVDSRARDFTALVQVGTKTYYAMNVFESDSGILFTTELTRGGNSTAHTADAATRVKFQKSGNFVFASFQSEKVFNNTRQYPAPKRIYRAGSSGLNVHEVGLPNPDDSSSSWSIINVAPPVATGSYTYLYALVWKYEYVLDGVTYIERSDLSELKSKTTTGRIGVDPDNALALTNLPELLNLLTTPPPPASGDYHHQWDTVAIELEIYRTQENETTLRLVGTVSNGTTGFTDTTLDADLGEDIYNSDGSYGYEQPAPCKFMHVVGDIAYYGGFDIKVGGLQANAPQASVVRQSIPGVITAAPADFDIAAPGRVTWVDSVDIYPIIFCRNSCWRIEGTIDSFGNGNPVLRPISETRGCIIGGRPIRTDQGLVFPALDGFYLTDGFGLKKLSEHRNAFYRSLWTDLTEDIDHVGRMGSAYHPRTKRFFYSAAATDTDSLNSGNNIVTVGDMRHAHESGIAFTDMYGGRLNAGYSLRPRGLAVFGDTLLVTDERGYVNKMPIEPTGSESTEDYLPESGVSTGSWKPLAVVFDYISAAMDLGSRTVVKWMTGLTLNLRFSFQQAAISIDMFTYRDCRFRDDSTKEEFQFKHIRKSGYATSAGFQTFFRRFPKGSLRGMLRQIRLKKAYLVLYYSNPLLGPTLSKATVNNTTNTAVLATGSWPTDVVAQTIFFENDDYTVGHEILTRTATTLTLVDTGNNLPTGAYHWKIKGYVRGQRFELDSYALDFENLATIQNPYKKTDEGVTEDLPGGYSP